MNLKITEVIISNNGQFNINSVNGSWKVVRKYKSSSRMVGLMAAHKNYFKTSLHCFIDTHIIELFGLLPENLEKMRKKLIFFSKSSLNEREQDTPKSIIFSSNLQLHYIYADFVQVVKSIIIIIKSHRFCCNLFGLWILIKQPWSWFDC